MVGISVTLQSKQNTHKLKGEMEPFGLIEVPALAKWCRPGGLGLLRPIKSSHHLIDKDKTTSDEITCFRQSAGPCHKGIKLLTD